MKNNVVNLKGDSKMAQDICNEWQLAEFKNLKVIGIFNQRISNEYLNYPSIRTDYIISPLILLQDYEKERIRGCTCNHLSWFQTKEDITDKYYIHGYWQKLGENNEIIETKEYMNHSDIQTFDSLIRGDVLTFEANIAFQYSNVKEDITTKHGFEAVNYIVVKECFIDNIRNVCKYEEKGAGKKIRKLIKGIC